MSYYRDMSEMTRVQYLRSEIVVSNIIYDTASKIYTAMIQTQQVTEDNMEDMMDSAIKQALELAMRTEQTMNTT